MIEKLKRQIETYHEAIKRVESRIDDCMRDKRDYEEGIYVAESKIEKIKAAEIKDQMKRERNENFKLTGDKFTDALRKASLFTSLDSDTLSRIEVMEGKVLAHDGYTGIIIESDVPEDKINKSIEWNLKSEKTLIENSLDIITWNYEATKKVPGIIIKEKVRDITNIPKLEAINGVAHYTFLDGDGCTTIQAEFLDRALMIFDKGDEIKITLPSAKKQHTSAVIIEDDIHKVILMPLRRDDTDY